MPTHCIVDAEKDASMKNISPKEAIEVLKDMKIETPLPKAAVTQRKRNAAIEMAINVLKYSESPNGSDSISRKGAIDYLTIKANRTGSYGYISAKEIHDYLSRMPATQPEIIRCKNCIYYKWDIDMCDYPFSTAHNVVHENDFCSKAERRTDESD